MTLPLWDDLDVYLDTFGVEATWTTAAGAGKDIVVIFDKGPVEAPGGYQNTQISALCKSSDVEGVADGDTILVDNVTYYIIAVEEEATGTTKLILSKDAI